MYQQLYVKKNIQEMSWNKLICIRYIVEYLIPLGESLTENLKLKQKVRWKTAFISPQKTTDKA